MSFSLSAKLENNKGPTSSTLNTEQLVLGHDTMKVVELKI